MSSRSSPGSSWRSPQFGGYLSQLWLGRHLVNLITLGDYFDVALRDFGLLVGALALARLATSRAR